MRSEEEIKEEIEYLKKRKERESIFGNHNGYFEIDGMIKVLKWVLEGKEDE